MKNKLIKKTVQGLVLLTSLLSGVALAASEVGTGLDLSGLTDSVNFNPVLVAVMAIGSSIITLYAGFAGVRWVLRMVKGA